MKKSIKAKRAMVNDMNKNFRHSITKSCQLCNISRSSNNYKSKKQDDQHIIKRLTELAQKKRRYGCLQLHEILRREGLVINHKKTERLYKKAGLSLKVKKRKKISSALRLALPTPCRHQRGQALTYENTNL